jgi:hypothetical protein
MKFWPVSDPDSKLTAGWIRIRDTVIYKETSLSLDQDQDQCKKVIIFANIMAAISGFVLPPKLGAPALNLIAFSEGRVKIQKISGT